MIRVLVVDDHVLVRTGIRSLLLSIEGVEIVAEASSGVAAVELAGLHRPNVVLMDIAMKGMNGIDSTMAIKQQFPDIHVIVLSTYVNEIYVEQALRAGASGYLVKDSEVWDMQSTLEAVMRNEICLGPRVSKQLVESFLKREPGLHLAPDAQAMGDIQLTARQREILRHIAEGSNTKEIAQQLGISPKTVEAHRTQLMERLNIRDVPGLVRYAIRVGLITIDKL